MKSFDLNDVGQLFCQGKITSQEVVNKIAVIIMNYPAVFELHKIDEDFKSEIILKFLEKGEKYIQQFNPELGSFYTYIYSHVSGIKNSLSKQMARKSIKEECLLHQSLENYETNLSDFSIKKIEPVKLPYAVPKVSYKNLQEAFRLNKKSKHEKTIIVLLIKYAYYFADRELNEICHRLNISPEQLAEAMEKSRKITELNIEKTQKLIQSRNRSYYFHNRYRSQLQRFKKDSVPANNLFLGETLEKYILHTELWKRKNLALYRKFSHVSTPNRIIAEILGICERQVRYYIDCITKDDTFRKLTYDFINDEDII